MAFVNPPSYEVASELLANGMLYLYSRCDDKYISMPVHIRSADPADWIFDLSRYFMCLED